MKLIKPGYVIEEIDGIKIIEAIEAAGRTCYKSEAKIIIYSAEEFIKMIIKRGHESVLEHEKVTVRIICDRGVSHELVRHRIASFSQESTRYCNYSKDKFDNQLTFIIPPFVNVKEDIYHIEWKHFLGCCQNEPNLSEKGCESWWFWHCAICERDYKKLIELGWSPQQARSVLPNSLKTEIVITANLREWRLIFKQRTAKVAHPQMREIMCPLLNELKTKLPIIFDDINYG